jgi:predicted dehydrogenase
MSDRRLRTAVIGTGMIANAGHIPGWKNLAADIELVGVADPRQEAAEETARRHGIPQSYADPQRMLSELQPDIVSVCTPNMYHKQWSIAALQAGAHVLCEKPIATSHQDAVEMYAAAESAGRVLSVSQTLRFLGAFATAKELAQSGRLGEPYYAEARCIRRRGIPTWGMFHMQEHNAGGPLFDLGVHMIDLMFWIMGNPRAVAASGATWTKFGNRDEGLHTSVAESGAPLGLFTPRPYDHREFDVEDFATGQIRLANQALVNITACWAANLPESFEILIAGTEGGLLLPSLKLITNLGRYQSEVVPKVLPDPDVTFFGHWGATRNFVRAVRGQEALIVQSGEVLNVIRAIEGLYQSAAAGREVRLDIEKKVSGTICAKHPEGRFPAIGS